MSCAFVSDGLPRRCICARWLRVKQTELWPRLQALTLKKINNPASYATIFDIIERRFEWFRSREKVARATQTASKPAKEKAKAKASPESATKAEPTS